MWRDRYCVCVKGKMMSVKALAEAFDAPYMSCLNRFHEGYRDPWEILYGKGAKPKEFHVTQEQIDWLKETEYYRRGQKQLRGKVGHQDREWDIACDLIGIPRVFADELKEAMGCA